MDVSGRHPRVRLRIGRRREPALSDVLPDLGWSGIAVIAVSLAVGALTWVLLLWLLAWVAGFVARKLGGAAKMRDVRAALAWGMTPVIWSIVYRIPLTIFVSRFHVNPNISATTAIIEFAGKGGFAIVIVFLALQILSAVWCVWVASFCLAEAEQFPPLKGFAVLAITFSIPVVIAAAAVVNSLFHRS